MKTGKWLVAMVVSTVFSMVGYWIGAQIGQMTGYMISTVFGGVGLWYGAKWARDYFGF